MAPSVTPSPPGRPHEPSAETRGDHGRGRPDMHVEMELQKRALELLVAASRRSDVDRTGRRHEHVLVRRRWRLRASRKNQQGRSRERQRQQDYESPHRSHLSPGTRTGFIYRTASSCATARSCSPHVGQFGPVREVHHSERDRAEPRRIRPRPPRTCSECLEWQNACCLPDCAAGRSPRCRSGAAPSVSSLGRCAAGIVGDESLRDRTLVNDDETLGTDGDGLERVFLVPRKQREAVVL
jgi:hypothetical protein